MLIEGREIKDFTLKKFLGRGGFGEVWLAEKKLEITDKKVPFALKFIPIGDDEISNVGNVKREINTWIDASGNKNVLSVLDGFAFENYFVIVSEYANNGSLRDWLRKNGGKSPSVEKTVEIMGGLLDGLAYLHEQKIIHRDLKPENILLKGDVPCIADFGVSKMVETVSLTNSQLGTNSAGSPLYMSPESFERSKPTPQIDIWSAGVMLFEMLSGKTPYTAETIPALIFEIVTKDPRELPPDIPASIRNVVKKSLAKDLSQRFVSAKEMHDALMRALYLKDYPENALESETIAADKMKPSRVGDQTMSSAVTIPVGMYQETRNKKSTGAGKALAFGGIGAVVVLAASAGLYSLSNFGGGSAGQNTSPPANQRIVETNVDPASNSANQKVVVETIPDNNASNNAVRPNSAGKSKDEISVKVEKPKTQVAERQQPRVETPPKRAAGPKPAKPRQPGVTLDDLLKKN